MEERAALWSAIEDLQVAYNHLDWADPSDPDALDVAILNLAAAEKRLASILKGLRGNCVNGNGTC